MCTAKEEEENEVRCGKTMRRTLTTIIHGAMPVAVWYAALRGPALKRRSFWWTFSLLGVYACMYGSATETRIYADVPLLSEMGLTPGMMSVAIITLVLLACYAMYAALATT